MLLIAALFTSYILQQKRIQAVHETVISIFAGMVVGLVIRLSPGTAIQDTVSFDYQFFFNLLLPPIILASGYELHQVGPLRSQCPHCPSAKTATQANFFRNIGTILTFAFAGTFISAISLGLILWLWTRIPFDGLTITWVEAISVGATLSATDPVTILAIFNLYKVEPKLYTIIFGESILNDAIAIVLFETAQRYKDGGVAGNLGIVSLFEAIGFFLLVFFTSLVIGVIVGVGTALILKYTLIRRFPKIESCLVILIAYACYFFSNGVHMSGNHVQFPFARLIIPANTNFRNRLPPLLWNHTQTLRILQHVSKNPTHHKIHLPNSRTVVRKFHLHLPWSDVIHRDRSRIQTFVYSSYRGRYLCSQMVGCVPSIKGNQLYH